MELNLSAWTLDVGVKVGSAEAFAAEMTNRVRQSWEAGADVVLFPEYAWMGLAPFTGAGSAPEVAALFWETLWPKLKLELSNPDKAAVLGTVPWLDGDSGQVRNRAPILSGGRELFQDKLCLTPWEKQFTGGDALHVWDFKGFRLAVLVCLDVEIPEHAAALRGRGVDVLLVPSATETILGMERIARCASARSVELGCCSAVSHLVGNGAAEMVDENVGRVAFYLPSQAPFRDGMRLMEGDPVTDGFHEMRCTVVRRDLELMRRNRMETNPSLLRVPQSPVVEFGASDPGQ